MKRHILKVKARTKYKFIPELNISIGNYNEYHIDMKIKEDKDSQHFLSYNRSYLMKECIKHGGQVYYRAYPTKRSCKVCVCVPVDIYKKLLKAFNELNSENVNLKYKLSQISKP